MVALVNTKKQRVSEETNTISLLLDCGREIMQNVYLILILKDALETRRTWHGLHDDT